MLRATKEYSEAFSEAVNRVTPDVLKKAKECFFNRGKIILSDTPWLPLEQAWTEYKLEHHITDEDVKKAIAEEEEKEKKMKKTWWQVWK